MRDFGVNDTMGIRQRFGLVMVRLGAGSRRGAIVIEYAFSMAIATIILMGVYELFLNMWINVLSTFAGLVKQPYP